MSRRAMTVDEDTAAINARSVASGGSPVLRARLVERWRVVCRADVLRREGEAIEREGTR